MTDSLPLEDVAAANEASLEALAQAIDLSTGQFALILVRCNYTSVREQMVQRLQEKCPVEIRKLVLDKSIRTLYTTIKASLSNQQLPALMVLGLESVSAIDQVLVSTNQVREQFRKYYSFPLILWITDELLQKLIQLVPDFESWATTYEFTIATNKLIEFLQQTTDEVFAKVLDAGSSKFLDNADLDLAIGSSRRTELESAYKDLQDRGIKLKPELEASLEFVLGRDASSSLEQSRQHYERSLEFWQQSRNLERQGCLLFCLGLCWRTYAVVHRADYVQACSQAKQYYQQCVAVFQQANRLDLQAKFINGLGDVLQRLKQWNELETVAKKALELHQKYSDPVRLAYAYGLRAEVAIAKSAWTPAQQYAQTALQILASIGCLEFTNKSTDEDTNLDRARRYHQGWYLLLLATAQQRLGQVSRALQHLKAARAKSNPKYDPSLYIRILETLRSLYFSQGEYLEAFEIKQEQRSIEQQYGFRAFIGAGQLQPQGQVINQALAPIDQQTKVAQALAASGRQQDVEDLIQRIIRPDYALTVIYGQSGVGKSSLINAGLVPALKERGAGEQDALTIVLRSYTDWERDLEKYLMEALEETRGISLSTPLDSKAAILEQLQKNQNRNLRTILIFDQFVQFFFVKEEAERQAFWCFLRDCLNTSSVKVILSLRQDYLHYLLEAERLTNIDGTRNDILRDILSKNNRYYLDNFSPEEARSVIKQLTERSQFYLEPELIDELVLDLTRNLREVRPIELQVVGAQLQTDPKIQTIEQYRQRGPKEKLVQGFLEEVIKDCGPSNEYVARLVLYLLTDENLTRPLRSCSELIAEANKSEGDLAGKEAELQLVLKIFVKSGLVSLLQEVHSERYQLVHDYLISFIRQQNDEGVLAQRRAERTKLKIAEQRLHRMQKWRFAFSVSVPLTIGMAIVSFITFQNVREAEKEKIKTLISSAKGFLLPNQEFDALLEGLRAARAIERASWVKTDARTKNQIDELLQQALYRVRERNRLEGHSDVVFNVSFSPDGKMLASASGDNTVKLWQRDGTLLTTLKGHLGKVISASFSPDGQTIASASYDKTVKLWQRDGTLLKTLTGHSDQVWGVGFSPDSQTIASTSRDKTVKLWQRNGSLLTTLRGHKGWVGSVDFSPDNQMIVSASGDNTLKLWQRDGTLSKTLNGHTNSILDVSFSPDGKTLASASADKTVKLWRRDGTLLTTLKGHEDRVFRVGFSPDGQTIASASADKTVKLWQRDGTLFKTLNGHNDEVFRVSFSPDSQTLASASEDNTVKLWRLDGTLITTLNGHSNGVLGISFSPDGETLASASYDKTVKLWQLHNTFSTLLKGHKGTVSKVSFSPDGQTIASASANNTVELRRRDGTLLKTFAGHTDQVYGVSFSPDGQTIASTSADKTVKLWRRDGTLFTTLTGHTDEVHSVSFSPDGKTLTSANADETITWTLLSNLLEPSCYWLKDYLKTNPNIPEQDHLLCKEINFLISGKTQPGR